MRRRVVLAGAELDFDGLTDGQQASVLPRAGHNLQAYGHTSSIAADW